MVGERGDCEGSAEERRGSRATALKKGYENGVSSVQSNTDFSAFKGRVSLAFEGGQRKKLARSGCDTEGHGDGCLGCFLLVCWIAILRTWIPNLRCATPCGERWEAKAGGGEREWRKVYHTIATAMIVPKKNCLEDCPTEHTCERTGDERKGGEAEVDIFMNRKRSTRSAFAWEEGGRVWRV